jgi:sugar O-acyltransferase (sialic acid O-acetyltransferase NeuD family)
MRNLIIIGAGGMGRTLYDIAIESRGYGTDYIIKGFVNDVLYSLEKFSNYPPIIGTIRDYVPEKDDVFVCSIGDVVGKKKCCEMLLSKGAQFITLIHSSARISMNAKIGIGTIIGAFVTIGADAIIGDYTLIQSYSVISHDVIVGNWSRVDTHVVCVGGTKIGDEVSIHTAAVINHKVTVGNKACVGANSFVLRSVKEGITVFGNPAKRII